MIELKKIRAITVLEVMISLIISSIVISLAYQSFQIIKQINIKYSDTRSNEESFLAFDKVFAKDFQFSEAVSWKGNNVISCNLAEREILYHFNEAEIIREINGITDTFFVKNDTGFNFLPVQGISEAPLIESVEMETVIGENENQFTYIKTYSPDIIIRNKLSEDGRY